MAARAAVDIEDPERGEFVFGQRFEPILVVSASLFSG